MYFIKKFLQTEYRAGVLLAIATLCAVWANNSFLQADYKQLLDSALSVHLGGVDYSFSFMALMNEGCMSLFFLLTGLEIKREILEGRLQQKKDCLLPAIAALGGIILPALIYLLCTRQDPTALQGWAIPCATDIAFSLGIVQLLGKRVPEVLKIFLLSLAIFDDMAAILIVALFYINSLSVYWLLSALGPLMLLALLARQKVSHILPYIMLGLILWLCIVQSGMHATIAGILLSVFIPLRASAHHPSPLKTIEEILHPWVSYLIVPLFAFLNAGFSIPDCSLQAIMHPIATGIMLGLLFGKPCGVLLFSSIAIACKICDWPAQIHLKTFVGIALLTGVGFTMSLFIGQLAFPGDELQNIVSSSVIMASLISGLLGYFLLFFSSQKPTLTPPSKLRTETES